MSRQRRSWKPGEGQHVISRFIDRKQQLSSEVDRAAYLQCVEKAHNWWDWRWLSYALMSSHVHDGLLAGNQPFDGFYRSTHIRYAQYVRQKTGSLGSIFAGRPKNYDVKRSCLAKMVAYHHRNPVKAGVVAQAKDSPWTSHRAYLRMEKAPAFLDVEWALNLLDFDDSPGGRRSFDEFVNDFDFDAFHESQQDEDLGRLDEDVALNQRKTELDESQWSVLLAAVAAKTSVPLSTLCFSRQRTAVGARRLAAHIAIGHLGCGLTGTSLRLGQQPNAIANLLGRLKGSALRAANEDAREILKTIRWAG